MRISLAELLVAGIICAVVAVLTQDGLSVAAVATLLACLKLVWTGDGLFVLPAALTFHWVETSIGLFHKGIFGRELPVFYSSDYRPMVLIALGCCLAIAVGLRIGLSLMKDPVDRADHEEYAFSFGLLVTLYLVSTAFEGTVASLGWEYPSVRQIIVTADTARLGILFLLLRRLLHPRPKWSVIGGVLLFEVGLGITGFFAGFREPLVLAALALMEIFDRRSVKHWFAMTAAGIGAVAFGLLWMGIRGEYRRNFVQIDNFEKSRSARLDNIETLSLDFMRADGAAMWETADRLVDRMWPIYYPALAVERVPSHVPHSHGAILLGALTHIVTPRVLFPGKADLESDSEKVRKYSGVMVAGAEQNTSIAFGYAAEAYIDFGVPLMFVPVLVFGVCVGWVYAFFRKRLLHYELFVAYGTVTFWLSLYLFERSWATMLGITLGMFVYLGAPVYVLDRLLYFRRARQAAESIGLEPSQSSHYA